jgi:predicted Zn-dependent protease
MNRPLIYFLVALLASALLGACAVNPVTGERNVQFYDEAWEQEIGATYYAPLRQQQGGDFVLDPELLDYVQSVGQDLAGRARRQDSLDFEFNIINDSTPNAWALPGGKISVNRGLLTELNSEAELAAVLGHEIVHADAAHSARQQSKGLLTQVGAIAGMVLIGSQAESSAGKAAAVIVPTLGAQMLGQKYSRDAEREADDYGMRYMSEAGYDPAGAVELQETFVRLSEGRDQSWLNGLFASHPPSRERVERNRATAATLPAGGDLGSDRYQQKTAYLRKIEPAYAAYDRALKAASKEDFDGARKELDRALAIEPREALFHALDGDLQRQSGNNPAALSAFEQSVALNPGYFYGRLRRGEMYLAAGRTSAARADLQRSLELLPTALGHYLVGNLERDSGNVDAARLNYRKAAASDSEVGRKARLELDRLGGTDATQ